MLTDKSKYCFCWFFPLLLLAIMVGGGCQPAYPKISLKPPEDVETVTAPTPHYLPQTPTSFGPEVPFIRLAIAPVVSLPQTRENYRKLLAYLPEKLEQPLELVLRPTYAEINQLIKQGLVDVALIGSRSYVELEKDVEIEILVVPQNEEQDRYHSFIIVQAESSIYHVEDLQNKKFVFTDPLSYPGKLYVLHHLAQMGENPDTFFSDYIYSYSNDNSIIAVAEGWVEAAAVDSLVYNSLIEKNPELEKKTRVIEVSPAVGNPPLIISANVSDELRNRMEEIFLSMHRNAQGQEVLAEMGIERFVLGKDDDYDFIRDILDESAAVTGEAVYQNQR